MPRPDNGCTTPTGECPEDPVEDGVAPNRMNRREPNGRICRFLSAAASSGAVVRGSTVLGRFTNRPYGHETKRPSLDANQNAVSNTFRSAS